MKARTVVLMGDKSLLSDVESERGKKEKGRRKIAKITDGMTKENV